ncbi:SDR family NAD(P)-dependent oxidoreductase [Amycolatopsis anabasis]|uniref:SDR family NAD(P)-dependent oxidoreductase n=1 Tax=Amycolatopsis anabasis TaxID=1840409 RepID=UPI00131AAAA2|nr:SDR family NAD(P)-dependent oxidoreductase [Amycolatopsis anabasis]
MPTALVTGADSGVGYDTARALAADGHTVLVHAPTAERGEEALERLVKGGAEPLRLHTVTADFARLHEVSALAREVATRYPALDLLVNTATITGDQQRLLTEDGNELTFGVNYLAPYLLTRLLEVPLKAARGRVVNVSSTLHRGSTINWADPNRLRPHSPLSAYAQSALAVTLFTRALAEFWPDGPVAISVDPGTDDRKLLRLHGRVAQRRADGAAVLARLCSPEFEVDNGAFYEGLTPAAPPARNADRRSLLRLWKLSAELVKLS